ncbi:MAG: hypothetical protein A2157_10820 [Deltaproteobacteria bacterium RBG_16_47_11]|nr:MAG: hypothetical protein A2157_10820 [Deltaproteobacteria bacterium RBG_16_47_11]
MRMNKIKLVFVVAACLLLIFVVIANGGPIKGPAVKIGVQLATSGPTASYGKMITVAAKMAEEEINKAGGIGGIPLQLIFADNRADPGEAVLITRKFIAQDRVLALGGIFNSGPFEPIAAQAAEHKTPVISCGSVKPGITQIGKGWAFRNTSTDDKNVVPTVEFFKKKNNIKTAALVYDSKGAWAKNVGEVIFPMACKKADITIVNADKPITYEWGDIDFSAQVTRLQGLKFDGVLIGGIAPEGAHILKEMRRRGLNQPACGALGWFSPDFAKVGGKAVEGAVFGVGFWPDNPDPKTQRFVKEFAERTNGAEANYRDVGMYDSLFIFKHVIEKYGITNDPGDLEKDRDLIRKGIKELKDFQGAGGKIAFDENGDGIKDTYVLVIKNGRVVKAE